MSVVHYLYGLTAQTPVCNAFATLQLIRNTVVVYATFVLPVEPSAIYDCVTLPTLLMSAFVASCDDTMTSAGERGGERDTEA